MPRPIEHVLDSIYYSNLENFGDSMAEPFGSESTDEGDDEEDINRNAMIHTAPGGGQHAPYRINEDGGDYKVVNDQGETKGTHDTKEDALDQQAALYVNVPGAKEEAEEDEKSKGKSSRRKLADGNDSKSGGGPTFTAPDSMRGSWSCSDCPADDLGVHDLNSHAEAHRQTTHRASMVNEILFL
jgi:hypothetical protein